MLYYRKPESGTSLFGAPALIYTIEALKHAAQRLLGDTYAVILYIDTAYFSDIVKRYLDPAAVLVVLYLIADYVFNKLVNVLICGVDGKAVTRQIYRNILCRRSRFKAFFYRGADLGQLAVGYLFCCRLVFKRGYFKDIADYG